MDYRAALFSCLLRYERKWPRLSRQKKKAKQEADQAIDSGEHCMCPTLLARLWSVDYRQRHLVIIVDPFSVCAHLVIGSFSPYLYCTRLATISPIHNHSLYSKAVGYNNKKENKRRKRSQCFDFFFSIVCPVYPRILCPKIPNCYFQKISSQTKSFIPRSVTRMRTRTMNTATEARAMTMSIIPIRFHPCPDRCLAPILDTVSAPLGFLLHRCRDHCR